MGFADFLKPNGEKIFLFAIILVFSFLTVVFNMPVFMGVSNTQMLEFSKQGYFFGPPSFASVLVITFAIAPVIIVIAYLMACMLVHPRKTIKTIKKKKIKKRK